MLTIVAIIIVLIAAGAFFIFIYALADVMRLEFLYDHDKEAYYKEMNNRELNQKNKIYAEASNAISNTISPKIYRHVYQIISTRIKQNKFFFNRL